MSPNFNTNMFQRNAKKSVKRSFKDLSHEWKHDFTLGNLIPCLAIPTLPGDDFQEIRSQFFFKFDPLYYPMIHRVQFDCDYWWVRNANMWKAEIDNSWEKFITLSSTLEHPTVQVDMWDDFAGEANNNSVYGYCGVPYLSNAGVGRDTVITGLNAFLGMAYLQIYDQGYRHPQLEAERANFSLEAGDNTVNMTNAFDYYGVGGTRMRVFPAKWGKDYFTSLLPEPSQGEVSIPLIRDYDPDGINAFPGVWKKLSDGTAEVPTFLTTDASGNTISDAGAGNEQLGLDIQATAATMREFSLASMLQTFREMLMRWGNRYPDWLQKSHDVDIDPDGLSIPRLLGSYRGTVNVTETLTQANTTVGESNFFTGDYTGNASMFEKGQNITFKCPDYGILMAIFSLTPNTGYGQGIPRWLRYSDPLDYPMDIFQGVGDQEILKEELMYNNLIADAAKNREVLGYGVRYQEAMTIPNNYGSNLAMRLGLSMHLGKWYDPLTTTGATYDSLITLNREFLEAGDEFPGGTRVSDVFKTLTDPQGFATEMAVVGYIYHKIGVMRPLAAFSTPGDGL